MRLKKIFATVLMLVTVMAFTGCGEEEKAAAPVAKIGMLQQLNASEQEFNGFMKKVATTFALNVTEHEVIYFNNFNSMQMALESGQIAEISTYQCVADYLAAKNPKIEVLTGHTMEFIDAFCFALRAGDTDLKTNLDNVINEMKTDGTLDKLTKEYIKVMDNPTKVQFEKFDGADTLKIAVTGDLPPLDLVLSDGTPAGFNTAVLSEIGKRLQKNIEIIQVDSAARAAALTSGQADIVFWAIVPVSEIIPSNADKPDGVELTSPYYRGRIVHIGLKK